MFWFTFAVCFLVHQSCADDSEVKDPLILTPMLESGNVTGARELSRVKPDIANTTSYSGYFTVNKECKSNLFFWFFPAQKNSEHAPVLVWLQGGPGMSSLMSLFQEIGPLTYSKEEGVGRRQLSWNAENNLLFIDQPVGTGYSFGNSSCYIENSTQAGAHLYSALLQFYQLFPELLTNKFFIAGQSYGGHFVPALGHTIHINNPNAEVKINLVGMMISDGFMDVFYQSDYSDYFYQLGLVDDNGKKFFLELHQQLSEHLKNKEWEAANEIFFTEILDRAFTELVGSVSSFNYLKKSFNLFEPYESFIQEPSIRNSIHVGNTEFDFLNYDVRYSIIMDFISSVKPWVEELLEHYPMVFYTGQLDVITPYPLVVNFLKALQWSGRDAFKNATRQKWCIGDDQAGYLKSGGNLYDVMVQKAGHIVSLDQPLSAFTLMNSVTSTDSTKDNPFHALSLCEH